MPPTPERFERIEVDDRLTRTERAELRERHAALRERLRARNDDWSAAVEAYAAEHGYNADDGHGFAAAALEFRETEAGTQCDRRKQEILAEKARLYRSVLEARFDAPAEVSKRRRIGLVYRVFGHAAHSEAIAGATDASESYIDQFRAVDVIQELPSGEVGMKFDREAYAAGKPAIPLQDDREQRRDTVSESVRERVLDRDDGQCRRCGADTALEIHHIRPVSHGGEDRPDNLAALCAACHERAHQTAPGGGIVPAYPLDQFEDWLNGELNICGAPTADDTPCQNLAGSCPHHKEGAE